MTTLRNFLTTQGYTRISLSKLNTGHYKVSLRINGKKGQFILDTGASTSCVGLESAALFLLQSEKSDVKAAGAGAINMVTKISKNNLLQLDTVLVKAVHLVLFDLSHVNQALTQVDEEPVHGILGADMLKKLRAVIDYGRNCIYLK